MTRYSECPDFIHHLLLLAISETFSVSLSENRQMSAFEKPWQPEYKSSMLSAIVGIEVSINEIQCKYKLSQNRSSQDHYRKQHAVGKEFGYQSVKAKMQAIVFTAHYSG
jgi:predicted FMN-binding regulatory protein PaiB